MNKIFFILLIIQQIQLLPAECSAEIVDKQGFFNISSIPQNIWSNDSNQCENMCEKLQQAYHFELDLSQIYGHSRLQQMTNNKVQLAFKNQYASEDNNLDVQFSFGNFKIFHGKYHESIKEQHINQDIDISKESIFKATYNLKNHEMILNTENKHYLIFELTYIFNGEQQFDILTLNLNWNLNTSTQLTYYKDDLADSHGKQGGCITFKIKNNCQQLKGYNQEISLSSNSWNMSDSFINLLYHTRMKCSNIKINDETLNSNDCSTYNSNEIIIQNFFNNSSLARRFNFDQGNKIEICEILNTSIPEIQNGYPYMYINFKKFGKMKEQFKKQIIPTKPLDYIFKLDNLHYSPSEFEGIIAQFRISLGGQNIPLDSNYYLKIQLPDNLVGDNIKIEGNTYIKETYFPGQHNVLQIQFFIGGLSNLNDLKLKIHFPSFEGIFQQNKDLDISIQILRNENPMTKPYIIPISMPYYQENKITYNKIHNDGYWLNLEAIFFSQIHNMTKKEYDEAELKYKLTFLDTNEIDCENILKRNKKKYIFTYATCEKNQLSLKLDFTRVLKFWEVSNYNKKYLAITNHFKVTIEGMTEELFSNQLVSIQMLINNIVIQNQYIPIIRVNDYPQFEFIQKSESNQQEKLQLKGDVHFDKVPQIFPNLMITSLIELQEKCIETQGMEFNCTIKKYIQENGKVRYVYEIPDFFKNLQQQVTFEIILKLKMNVSSPTQSYLNFQPLPESTHPSYQKIIDQLQSIFYKQSRIRLPSSIFCDQLKFQTDTVECLTCRESFSIDQGDCVRLQQIQFLLFQYFLLILFIILIMKNFRINSGNSNQNIKPKQDNKKTNKKTKNQKVLQLIEKIESGINNDTVNKLENNNKNEQNNKNEDILQKVQKIQQLAQKRIFNSKESTNVDNTKIQNLDTFLTQIQMKKQNDQKSDKENIDTQNLDLNQDQIDDNLKNFLMNEVIQKVKK